MNSYEIFLSVLPEIQPQGVASVAKKMLSILEKGSVSIKKVEYLGLKKFAYPIKKNQRARCYIIYFECNASVIPALNSYLRVNEGVIRYLVLKNESMPKNPSQLFLDKSADANPVDVKDYGDLFSKKIGDSADAI
jgi:small subunit ribosomal protein S6